MNHSIFIRRLTSRDCQIISQSFQQQGWNKPPEQYQNYLIQQNRGEREVLIAELENEFAGYLTILWQSKYPPFRENNVPEINDFNVLIKFRKCGVGAALMDAAESLVAKKTETVGIGVGLTFDYGAAQRLYVKRGYVPDGRGVSQNGKILKYGDKITINDDLTMWLAKQLTKS